MSQTKIRAHSQVLPNSITDTEVSATAAIQTTKLADAARIMFNDGTTSFVASVTGVDPTLPQHLATKNYVDSVIQSLDIKQSVLVATTGANIGVSGSAPVSLDGIALAVGSRVLVKDQTTPSQNGIYVVQTLGTGSNGVWVRSTDANVSADVTSGMYTYVASGTTNASSGWVLSTAGTIVLGTTNLTFTQFSGAGQITAGNGLAKAGNTLSVVTVNAARILTSASGIDLATTGVAASTYQSVTVDAYGRVTAGANPTTLAGYGITDAQPLNSTLTAIAGLGSSTGIVAKTGTNTTAVRTLQQPSQGMTITNPDGVAGNPTFTFTNDLGALQGLTGTGIAVRTGTYTWAQISVAGTAGQITVANGNGVAGNPTISLATSGIAAGTYFQTTVDTYGRSTAGVNPTTLSGFGITDGVNIAGSTMTGFLTLNANPTSALHAATKGYVDAVQQSLQLKASVLVATTGAVTLVGGAPSSVDGFVLTVNARVLVLFNTNPAENGIYTVQTLGTGANGTWIRSTDANISSEVNTGMYCYVEEGTMYGQTGWVLTTLAPITLGTTALSFTQFSGAGQIIAGTGIVKSGNTLSVVSANAGITSQAGSIALTLADSTLTIASTGLKLASLPNGQLLVGNSLGVATPVTMSGDVTMSNLGVTTVNSNLLRATNYQVRETPSGNIDGINTTYTLLYAPVVGTEMVFANGILLEQGTGNDYTISGATITLLFTLQAGDRIKATYFH